MIPAGPPPLGRVLVVDDEPSITDLVSLALRHEGYQVVTAADGTQAVRAAREQQFDVIILDVMLPDEDGFSLLRRLLGEGVQAPVLFLTARNTPADRVHGLRLGADDYLGKPFSIAELIARVQVIQRRAGRTRARRFEFADLVLDEETFEVTRQGIAITLAPTEFRLLRYFLMNARRVLTKQQILDHVWDYSFSGDPAIVETYVSYLRRKIDQFDPPLIQTVRGFGYALRLPAG